MSPSEVFLEDDWEIQAFYEREMSQQPLAGDGDGGGEDWDAELLVPAPGRLVYVGQGQCHYTFFHQPTPDLLYPKRKKKKKKKKKKAAPEPAPPPPVEDWDAEIAASQPKEDWDAEIAASQ